MNNVKVIVRDILLETLNKNGIAEIKKIMGEIGDADTESIDYILVKTSGDEYTWYYELFDKEYVTIVERSNEDNWHRGQARIYYDNLPVEDIDPIISFLETYKNEFLSESMNLSESQISFWTSPKSENKLVELGFTIPPRPKQGDVMYNGEKVGYMSNFSGLVFTKEFSEENRDWLSDIANQIGVGMWN